MKDTGHSNERTYRFPGNNPRWPSALFDTGGRWDCSVCRACIRHQAPRARSRTCRSPPGQNRGRENSFSYERSFDDFICCNKTWTAPAFPVWFHHSRRGVQQYGQLGICRYRHTGNAEKPPEKAVFQERWSECH